MPLEKSISKLDGQKGFTLIEIIIASLILTLIVAAVVQYHSSVGVSKGQQYYLKAVQTARSELDKLRALYEFDTDSSFAEFDATVTPPDNIFLFKFKTSTEIEYLPAAAVLIKGTCGARKSLFHCPPSTLRRL